MTKHPKAGHPVKIANGPLKGKYFIVTDWFVRQFQGKPIAKLAKTHSHLVTAMTNRGFPLDQDVVFGRLHPKMEWTCVHDKELLVDMHIVEDVELPPNVESIAPKKKKKKDKSE